MCGRESESAAATKQHWGETSATKLEKKPQKLREREREPL